MSMAIRERALMLARVANSEFGNRVIDLSNRIVEGRETEAKARLLLRDLLDEMDYQAPEGKAGTIQDLRSDVRLNLILRMQVQGCYGFAHWRQGQTRDLLDKYPAQELYRAYPRKEPRDWPTRWQEAGGRFYEGRMIAPKNDIVWVLISAFGTPYPPFDFNSGMDVMDVRREEAVELGVIAEGQIVVPQRRDFEQDSRAGVASLLPEMEQVLIETLGGGWEMVDGVLAKANEQKISQLQNAAMLDQMEAVC